MSNFGRLDSYYKLTKPTTAIIPLTAYVVGQFVTTRTISISVKTGFGGLALFLLFLGGCILDEYGDREIDKKINPDQPLVTKDDRKKIPTSIALSLASIFFIVGLSIAFVVLGMKFFLIMATYPVLAVLYSINPRISDMGLLGNFTFIGFSVSLPFLAGVISVGEISLTMFLTSILFLLLGTGLDLVKDFVKYHQDIETNRQSILKSIGIKKGTKLIALSVFLPCIISPILIIILDLNILYLLITICICSLLIILSGEILISKPPMSSEIAQKMERKNKALMVISYGSIEIFLIGIVIGII